jgi:hypothetical protein
MRPRVTDEGAVRDIPLELQVQRTGIEQQDTNLRPKFEGPSLYASCAAAIFAACLRKLEYYDSKPTRVQSRVVTPQLKSALQSSRRV